MTPLQQAIHEAFGNTPQPRQDEIVAHECSECFQIRDDFSPHIWSEVPQEIFEHNWDSFSLFTPKAFLYYLPGYMLYALNYPDSEVTRRVVQKLGDLAQPDQFWGSRANLLSAAHKTVIRKMLYYVHKSNDFRQYRADSYDALILWDEKPAK